MSGSLASRFGLCLFLDIMPLQFEQGENAESLRPTGEEIFHIEGQKGMLDIKFAAGKNMTVKAET